MLLKALCYLVLLHGIVRTVLAVAKMLKERTILLKSLSELCITTTSALSSYL